MRLSVDYRMQYCTSVILPAVVLIKCGHPLKFDEIVAGNGAQIESDFASAILRTHALLHTTISKVVTHCNLAFARNIACSLASCGLPSTLELVYEFVGVSLACVSTVNNP